MKLALVLLVGVSALGIKAEIGFEEHESVDKAIGDIKLDIFLFSYLSEQEINRTIVEAYRRAPLFGDSFDRKARYLTDRLNDLAKKGDVERNCVSISLPKIKDIVNKGKAEVNYFSSEISQPMILAKGAIDIYVQEMESKLVSAYEKIIPECEGKTNAGSEFCVDEELDIADEEAQKLITKNTAIFKSGISQIAQLSKAAVSASVKDTDLKLGGIFKDVRQCIKDGQ